MNKLLVALTLSGAAAGLAYALAASSPEERICRNLDGQCGGDGSRTADCETSFAEVQEALGREAVETMADCTDESTSCADAAGCVAGGGVRGAMHITSEFSHGFDRALRP